MCGVTGFAGGVWDHSVGYSRLRDMNRALYHRGPDSEGEWVDQAARIALGHRRLAILDLTPAGAQPMTSPRGRYVAAFNGEIYNHLDLRSELESSGESIAWRGHSDTESLLAAMERWGIEAALSRAVGMFALAVWDHDSALLTLARDRAGEKPLYFGFASQVSEAPLLFGSELKALRAHPEFSARVDRSALLAYMQHMAVSGTSSIYGGISKVAAGSLVSFAVSRDGRVRQQAVKEYWSMRSAIRSARTMGFTGGPTEAVDLVEHALSRSVAGQMMADVPVGAFLSGGIDSSLVVAMMQQHSKRPVRTFSIGFNEGAYDEASFARAVAASLGTDHTELYVTPRDALDTLPRLPAVYDEPFADSSQIPTLLLSEMTRRHVVVSLSGDGGDELFAGYNRYLVTQKFWNRIRRVPPGIRVGLSSALLRMKPAALDRWLRLLPSNARNGLSGDRLHKGAALISSLSVNELYQGLITTWMEAEQLVVGAPAPSPVTDPMDLDGVEGMMAADFSGYLNYDVLTKVDRAAMSVSLETRVPFLDHRLIEAAWRLPLEYKLRNIGGELITKWPLRELLRRHVPRSLVDRPKTGFGVPIAEWLRGPLRDWAEGLLAADRIRREGYLDADLVNRKWREHLSGSRNWQDQIWTILMFQFWLECQ